MGIGDGVFFFTACSGSWQQQASSNNTARYDNKKYSIAALRDLAQQTKMKIERMNDASAHIDCPVLS